MNLGWLRGMGRVEFPTVPAEPSGDELARATEVLVKDIDQSVAREWAKAEPNLDRIDALLDRRNDALAGRPRRMVPIIPGRSS